MRRCGALLIGCLALACSTPCETTSSGPVDYRGGETVGNVYESSPWSGPWLHFPPGRRYKLFHELGREPTLQTYVSFSERGLADENNATESAGNQVVLEASNAEHIQVRNDTCAEYYLRVVATAPAADAGATPLPDASLD